MSCSHELPTEKEFTYFQNLVYAKLGIRLIEKKRAMLGHRLLKRVHALELDSFKQYYDYIVDSKHEHELKLALELITTNETFFFREIEHFRFLESEILSKTNAGTGSCFRVWSAACSTGEEPYSIAMTLQTHCRKDWDLLATDVNSTVLASARKGIYQDVRTELLSDEYRRRYCRKGRDEFTGYFRVIPELRSKVRFGVFNLLDDMKPLGRFDLVFLRNVLIYFDDTSKQDILTRMAEVLNPGGYLFTGHAESFHGLKTRFKAVKPAILTLVDE